jgi:LemA protein
LLFWSVGAGSRLRRLRADIARAFAALIPVWQRRLAWAQDRAIAESETGQRLIAARDQCALALEHACDKPFEAERIQSLALATNVLDVAWVAAAAGGLDRLPQADLNADSGSLTWESLRHQALPLQMAFNRQAMRYNHAIAQFPASVLALVLRFKRAELLPVELLDNQG